MPHLVNVKQMSGGQAKKYSYQDFWTVSKLASKVAQDIGSSVKTQNIQLVCAGKPLKHQQKLIDHLTGDDHQTLFVIYRVDGGQS